MPENGIRNRVGIYSLLLVNNMNFSAVCTRPVDRCNLQRSRASLECLKNQGALELSHPTLRPSFNRLRKNFRRLGNLCRFRGADRLSFCFAKCIRKTATNNPDDNSSWKTYAARLRFSSLPTKRPCVKVVETLGLNSSSIKYPKSPF
jgi:hypothetical protein